jgi:antitoxin ParD1/3/4
MGIVLPKEIEEMAARRASEEGFASVADYIARLVAWDAGGPVDSEEGLKAKLLEALDDDEEEFDIESMRAELEDRIHGRRGSA